MIKPGSHHDPETLDAIADLLGAAEINGYGVQIEPNGSAWVVSWVRRSHGGHLASGLTLLEAVTAAFEPLLEVMEQTHPRHPRP